MHHILQKKHKINDIDLSVFFKQLANLLEAGISIIKSLEILKNTQKKSELSLLITEAIKNVLSGKEFSFALLQYKYQLNPLIYNLIRIGEHTGKLDTMLYIIATHLDNTIKSKKRFKQALLYPIILIVITLIMIVLMLLLVIPHFANLLLTSNNNLTKLPTLTRFIFQLSNSFRNNIIFFIVLFTTILILLFAPIKSIQNFKKSIIQFFFHLPFIQSYLKKILLAQFFKNLSILLAAGIPLIDALKFSLPSTQNSIFVQHVLILQRKIASGLCLHQAMAPLNYFPALCLQMIKIGEETGMLDSLLNKSADFIDAEVHHYMTQLNTLLEPLIILILGVLIGGLIIGMYLPILNIGSTF